MSPNIHRSLFVAAVFAATIACASASGCAKPVLLIGTPIEDASASSPGFTPPDEDGGTSAQPMPPVPMCVATECPHPYATCTKANGTPAYKCEMNLLVDDNNCGACGRKCPVPSDWPRTATAACHESRCQLECFPGRADCDNDMTNGCETSIDSDPNNCGGCGIRCDVAAGQPCVRGQCALAPCPELPVQ